MALYNEPSTKDSESAIVSYRRRRYGKTIWHSTEMCGDKMELSDLCQNKVQRVSRYIEEKIAKRSYLPPRFYPAIVIHILLDRKSAKNNTYLMMYVP